MISIEIYGRGVSNQYVKSLYYLRSREFDQVPLKVSASDPLNLKVHLLIRKVLLVAICLLVIGAGWGFVFCQKDESARWVQHTLQVLRVQSELLSACQQASSSSRGYLLTRGADFKNAYKIATDSIDQQTLELEKLTRDNPSQQERLQRFKQETKDLQQQSQPIWQIAQYTAIPASVAPVIAGQKIALEKVRQTLNEIGTEEERLLDKRRQAEQNKELLLGFLSGILIAVSCLLLIYIVKADRQDERETKIRKVKDENATLQERQLASIVRSVKDYAIFMLDPAGNILTWNQGAQRLKGYSSEEIIGKNFSTFYPPDVAATGHPQHELAVALKEGRYEEEGWRVRKDGTRFWANVIITPVYEPDGRHVGFAKVTRDLTERKQEQQELTDARDKAIAADEAKTRFLSTVSHEVKTPMAGVIGLVELIALSTENDETVGKLAAAALVASKRLLQILNDLLDASRLQAGAVRLENRYFAVRPVIGDLVQLVNPEASKKELEVISRVADEVPEQICGDELRVRQILQNLAFNAVKFTHHGTVSINVELVTRSENISTLKFTVVDTGIGISPEEQEKLFQPFVQANDSTTRLYGGTGLGLSICRTLTSLMDGQIGVDSAPGEGATFWVVIPFRDDLCQT